MLHKLALAATLLVTGVAHQASAAAGWVNGNPVQNFTPTCGAGSGLGTATQIGYWADSTLGLHTGDVSYIHVVAQAGCAKDTVGFDMVLPAGAVPSVSPQLPVSCWLYSTTGVATAVVTTAGVSGCFQTPITGNSGNPLYGWTNLKPGELFEVQIPVKWTQASSSTTTNLLEAVVVSSIQWLTPIVTPIINYRPLFKTLAGTSSADGSSADVSFELDHFFTASQVVVEYGTGVFDHATPPVTTSEQFEFYPNVMANLPGTTPGSLLTWRVRITNAFGTFYSSVQTLALKSTVLPIVGPPRCNYFRC